MEDIVVEWLKSVNIIQLLAIGIMFWFFYNRLDKKMDVNLTKIEEKFEKIDARFDKIENELKEIHKEISNIDKRLYAVECMIHMQDGCIMKEDRNIKTVGE